MSTATFEGFEAPNTTPVPDVVFDKLLGLLTGNELKVLLYIVRRTYGFGKNADAISLSQFRDGIKTRNQQGEEKVLDYGCGIGHNRTILVALEGLETKGCTASRKRKAKAGDDDTTIYQLNFKKSNKGASQASSQEGVVTPGNDGANGSLPGVTTVVTPGNDGSYSESRPVVTPGNPQETVLHSTVLQEESITNANTSPSTSASDDALFSQIQKLMDLITQQQTEIASLRAQLSSQQQNTPPLTPPTTDGRNLEEEPPQGSDRKGVQGAQEKTGRTSRPKTEAQKAREAEKRAEKKRQEAEDQRRIQALVDRFVSLGQRYFEDPDFTVELGGPRTENYKAGLSIINTATTKGVDDVFLALWNAPSKDDPNVYFWQDPDHLTFRAFCRQYPNKIASIKFREKNPVSEKKPTPPPSQRYQRYEPPALTYLPPRTGAELRAMTSGI